MTRFLPIVLLSCLSMAAEDSESEPRLQIGDEEVTGKVVNGRIVGDRVFASSNSLIIVHAEVTPIHVPPDSPEQNSAFRTNEPALRLLMVVDKGGWIGKKVKGYRGPVYNLSDLKHPPLSRPNLIEVLCSEDKTTIVMLVLDNGPLYFSTNSGAKWTVFSAPGDYQIPLTDTNQDGGFIAAATLRSSSGPLHPSETSLRKLYALASNSDGDQLVLTVDPSGLAPALTISRSGEYLVLAWPAAFDNFMLEQNENLTASSWTKVTNAVQSVSGENRVFIRAEAAYHFYRLKSQRGQ